MKQLIKLILNSLFGDTFKKDVDYKHEFKTERWIEPEFEDRIEVYYKLEKRHFCFAKIKSDEGLHGDETSIAIRLPSQLGAFFLTNSKFIMNDFIKLTDGIETNDIRYLGTDSLYIEKKTLN